MTSSPILTDAARTGIKPNFFGQARQKVVEKKKPITEKDAEKVRKMGPILFSFFFFFLAFLFYFILWSDFSPMPRSGRSGKKELNRTEIFRPEKNRKSSFLQVFYRN